MKVLEEVVNGLQVAKEMGRAGKERERDASASLTLMQRRRVMLEKMELKTNLSMKMKGIGGYERMRR